MTYSVVDTEPPGAGRPSRPAPRRSPLFIPLLTGIFAVLFVAGLFGAMALPPVQYADQRGRRRRHPAVARVAINLLESNLLTPMVLGRSMPLNTVAVFVSLLFWGWVWGITGVIMAVPLTVMIQVVCSHSERLRPIAILLGNEAALAGSRQVP